MVYAQKPDATILAGYEDWLQIGRQVQRGGPESLSFRQSY